METRSPSLPARRKQTVATVPGVTPTFRSSAGWGPTSFTPPAFGAPQSWHLFYWGLVMVWHFTSLCAVFTPLGSIQQTPAINSDFCQLAKAFSLLLRTEVGGTSWVFPLLNVREWLKEEGEKRHCSHTSDRLFQIQSVETCTTPKGKYTYPWETAPISALGIVSIG